MRPTTACVYGFTEIHAHAGSRTRVTSMGGLYDTATLHAPMHIDPLCIIARTYEPAHKNEAEAGALSKLSKSTRAAEPAPLSEARSEPACATSPHTPRPPAALCLCSKRRGGSKQSSVGERHQRGCPRGTAPVHTTHGGEKKTKQKKKTEEEKKERGRRR